MEKSDWIIILGALGLMLAMAVGFWIKLSEVKSRLPITSEEVAEFQHCYDESKKADVIGQMYAFADYLEETNEPEEAKRIYSDIKETENRYEYICLQDTLEQLNKERK